MNTLIYRTSELADKAQVNRETIRFYEKKELLTKPIRAKNGYRQYSQKDLERLLFIRNAKELGFALSEIKELLAIADGDINKCSDVRQIAESKLDHINSQLKQLNEFKQTLTGLVSECLQADTIDNCPIIESLTKELN